MASGSPDEGSSPMCAVVFADARRVLSRDPPWGAPSQLYLPQSNAPTRLRFHPQIPHNPLPRLRFPASHRKLIDVPPSCLTLTPPLST